MLEIFHRCENFKRIKNPRETVKMLETFHRCENLKRIKNPRENVNMRLLLSDICKPATEPATESPTAESSETTKRGVARKKRSLLPRGCNKLTLESFYCYIFF